MRNVFSLLLLLVISNSFAETNIHDFDGCRYSVIKEVQIIRSNGVDFQSNVYDGERPFGDVKFRCDLDTLVITFTPNMFREDGTLLDKSKVDGIALYLAGEWYFLAPSTKKMTMRSLPTGLQKFAVTIRAGAEFSMPTAVLLFKSGVRVSM